ncbi:unnamed protein product [Allacma fusca]|uniref:Uncharacterized protein n=1 Tax=Allacma fusca TaxID=39272 RepID=A0A8J2LCV6_9HEXA|nr:unnamed protein product [Allacma fusca]
MAWQVGLTTSRDWSMGYEEAPLIMPSLDQAIYTLAVVTLVFFAFKFFTVYFYPLFFGGKYQDHNGVFPARALSLYGNSNMQRGKHGIGILLTSGQDLSETGIITTYLLVIGKTFYWIGIISLTFFLFKFATRFLFPGLTGGLHFDGYPPKYVSNQLNRNLTTRNGGVVGMDTNAATQLTAKVTRGVAGPLLHINYQ